MPEEKRSDRELIRAALTKLHEINENGEPMSGGLGGLIGCACAAARGGTMPDGEELEGAIICMIGSRGSQNTEMVGALNPIMAYGSLVDAIFDVREKWAMEETKQAVKSFVGDAQAALASIEKDLTKPDEH